MSNANQPISRDSVEQDQFLSILSREDALARFEAALFPRAVPSEPRALADALGSALAEDIVAPLDVPPFDRANVDGFAVRSADLAAASEARPVRVLLNDEVIACGTAPARPVLSARSPRLRPAVRFRAAPMPSSWSSTPNRSATARSRSGGPPSLDNSSPMPVRTSRAARRCSAPAP